MTFQSSSFASGLLSVNESLASQISSVYVSDVRFALSPRLRVFIVAIGCAVLFCWSGQGRDRYLGFVTDDGHQWLTGSTLKFAKNWHADGVWADRWAMLENPASVEFPDLQSRGVYPSYPPFSIVGPFVLSHAKRIFGGGELDVRDLQLYNRFNQFVIAVLLAVSIFFLTGSFAGAWSGAAIYIFHPVLYYYHQQTFFADHAVLVLFVGLVVSELAAILWPDRRRRCDAVSCAVLVFAIATDWLGWVLAPLLFLHRVATRSDRSPMVREASLCFLPLFGVAVLYGLQLVALDAFPVLVHRFFVRIGADPEGHAAASKFFSQFWLGYMGKLETLLYFATLIACAVGAFKTAKEKRSLRESPLFSWALFLVLLPPLVHVLVLRNHSSIHGFSAMKFFVPLALFPFALVPEFVARRWFPGQRRAIVLVAAMMGGLYVARDHRDWEGLFPDTKTDLTLAGRVRSHAQFQHVYFSKEFEIEGNPPFQLAYSGKRVYRFRADADIRAEMKRIASVANVRPEFFLIRSAPCSSQSFRGDEGALCIEPMSAP